MRNSCLITFLKKYRSSHRKQRSSHRRGPVKKVFLKILQTSRKNTCVGVFLIKTSKFEFIHIQYFFSMVRNKSNHRCSVGEGVLRNFLGKHLCQSLFFNKVSGLRKKETLTRAFSCEFSEIFKNTFFTEHLWTTASWETNCKY